MDCCGDCSAESLYRVTTVCGPWGMIDINTTTGRLPVTYPTSSACHITDSNLTVSAVLPLRAVAMFPAAIMPATYSSTDSQDVATSARIHHRTSLSPKHAERRDAPGLERQATHWLPQLTAFVARKKRNSARGPRRTLVGPVNSPEYAAESILGSLLDSTKISRSRT